MKKKKRNEVQIGFNLVFNQDFFGFEFELGGGGGGCMICGNWEVGNWMRIEDWEVGNWRSEDRGGKKKFKNNIGQRKKQY